MLLSVVIPIYNVEKYLRQCIDSVIQSSFKDWECILVDDGSRDNSGSICDEYVAKDSRFKVIHKSNGGLSSARNAGIEKAIGEWITFIDSDDYISPSLLSSLVAPILDDNSIDIVLGGCSNVIDGKVTGVEQKYESRITTDISFIVDNFRGLMHSKLIKTSVLNSNHSGEDLIRFDVNSKIEDMVFTSNYLRFIHKAVFIDETGYYYRRDNPNSLTKITDKWPYENVLYDWKITYKYISEICERNGIILSSLLKRRTNMGNALWGIIRLLYRSGFSKNERIRHLKNDFDASEIHLLQYSTYSKPLTRFQRNMLVKGYVGLFDCFAFIHQNLSNIVS